MFKKILIISLLIISISSFAFGVDYSVDMKEQLETLEQKNVIPTGFTQWAFNTSTYAYDLNRYCKDTYFKGYYFIKTASTGNYENKFMICFSPTDTQTNASNDSNNSNYYYWGYFMFIYNISSNSYSNSSQGGISMRNVDIDYAYTTINIQTRELVLNAGEEFGGNYLTDSFSFLPNYFQKVTFTGINDEFNALKYDYSIISWKLGMFENIPENVDKIVINLLLHDGGIALTDSFLIFTNKFSRGNFFIDNNNLYIYSRLVKYNTKYNLLMYTYDDSNNFIESYQYNYVFYPTNALIQNGSVVNSGSGDYSVQDSTNDTIAALTDSSDIDSILNLTFSGDYASFADDFGFLPFDNPFSTFLLHIVDSLYDALTVRGNASLTANYRNYFTFSINSDDFSADYQYKEFVSAMLVFIYLYYNFIFFNHLITLVEIGNVEDAIDLLGFDEFYDSNMM